MHIYMIVFLYVYLSVCCFVETQEIQENSPSLTFPSAFSVSISSRSYSSPLTIFHLKILINFLINVPKY